MSAPLWRAGSPRSLAFGSQPRTLLVLYQHTAPGPMRAALRQKLHALDASAAGHQVVYWNAGYPVPRPIRDLRVDAIVLDNTLLVARWAPGFEARRASFEWVAESPALRIAFPQDEYNHAHVLDDWLADLGIDVVFSIYGPEYRELLYPRLAGKVRFERALTGYIDETAASRQAGVVLPHARRPLDLAYRAEALSPRFGRLGQAKVQVAEELGPRARAAGLRVDVSVDRRDAILGERWFAFIASARAVLGSESGASAIDRRGELVARERELLAERPGLTFEEFDAAMPPGWDGTPLGAIGPRHLEAAVAKTAQVLVAGDYDGMLEPDVHYLAVRPDFADADEVVERLGDRALLERLAERTYRDIVLSGRYGYAALAARIETVLDEERPHTATEARGAAIRRAQVAAKAYSALVVRPPRWAWSAVDRVAPGVAERILDARMARLSRSAGRGRAT
ncbi:MAG TPA: hypothetical protein VFZ00_15985 [Solirubrobacter sp.]|nr:hypothetical protein [Solirubrobacter sp.]